MKFLSDILAKAGLTVDGVVTLNNTATGQTPNANDNSTKLATTAWVRTFVQPYSLPIATSSVLGGIKVGTGLSIDAGTGVLSVSGGGSASIKSTQTFTATAAQTVFTINGGYSVGLIDVFLNGVYLSPNQTTATNGTTVTLGDAALAGDIIDVIIASPVYQGATTTTDQLSEGSTNLYFTNARARAAISESVTGLDYNSATGVLSITTGYGIPTTASQTTWDAAYNDKINSAAVTGTTTKTLTLTQQDGGTITASWTDDNTDAVTSVFGRTGAVVAVSGDYTTALVTEVTNLYYTDARARAAISVTGSGSYDSATGIITVTGGVTSVNTLTGAVTLTTTNIGEGTNLYYTTARANSDFDTRLATKSTTNLAEGTNLYYTTARANSDFDTRLATKSTTNLAEGTNLYYTDTRVGTYLTGNSYATQSYVSTQINNLVSGAPGLLDTLDELAAALGDDPNFATTVTTALGNRLRIDTASQGLTGTQQGYGRTNLGLGSLSTLSSIGDAYITDLAYSKLTGVPSTFAPSAHTHDDIYYTETEIGNFFSGASVITGYNKTNWDTAYGWGNHASGGYLTTASATSTYVSLSGSYANPSWITSLAYSKITGVPAFITSYTEVDTLATVTGRGASTTSTIIINAGAVHPLAISSSQRYQMQVRNTSNSINSVYGWWWFMDTNFNMGFHADGASDRFTLTRDGNLSVSGTLSGSNLSGTNTGDQINISGNAATATNVAYSGLTGTVPTWNQNTTGTAANSTLWNGLSTPSGYTSTGTVDKLAGGLSGLGDIVWLSQARVQTFLGLGSLAYSSATIPTNNNQLTNGAGYITGISSGNVTTALGYTPWNYGGVDAGRNIVAGTNLDTDLESGGAYGSYGAGGTSWNAPFSYGAVLAFAFTSGIKAQFGFDIRHNQSDYGDLRYRTKNNLGYSTWRTMWHSGNLTNNNQLTNGAGYITSYSETDTLQSVTNRGASTSTSITAADFYTAGWFRNSGATAGLYNSTHNTHFYASSTGQWNFATSNNSWIQIALRPASHESTVRGFLYADTNNNVGLLTNDGNWGLRVDVSKNVQIYGTDLTVGTSTSSNIYMTDTDETTRRIHCNSGRIGFLNSANGWGAYCDNSGNWFANNLSGTNTGDQTNISGNAATATTAPSGINRGDQIHGSAGVTPATSFGSMPSAMSGFTDNWGGGDLPSGMSHVHGIACRHFNNASNNWGWHMVGQYDQPGDLRVRWVNAGTWTGYYQLISSWNIGSQSVSYASTAGSANSVAWSNVSGRPSALSQFSNDSGYITSSGSISGNAGSANVAAYARRIDGVSRVQITVGGNASTFYPVAISTGAGATSQQYSEFVIERGGYDDPGYTGVGFSTFNARFSYKPSGWGYGAVYWNLEQLGQTTTMLADYDDYYQASEFVVWLRGGTTYWLWSVVGSIGVIFQNTGGTSYNATYRTFGTTTTVAARASNNRNFYGNLRVDNNIYAGGGLLSGYNVELGGSDAGNVVLSTYNNRNLRVTGTGGSDVGICGKRSGGSFGFQVYGEGTAYGFLNSEWGAWNLKKIISGALYMNDNNSYYINTTGDSSFSGALTLGGALTVAGTTTLNSNVYISRHIDANTGWGSASGNTIFVGWSGGKVVLGSNANGGHDYARDITVASVVSTNPFFCYQDITAYSDARVKDNVEVIDNAVEKIKAIRGVTYTRTDNVDKTKRHAGVIAQEVLEVLPEVVNGSEDSVYSVAYGNLSALLIEAIKEQQGQIESQKSEIDELKGLVQQLINR